MVRSITGRTDCMSMTTRTTLLEYFTFRLHVMMRINIFIFRYFTIVNHMLSQIFLFGPLQALHSPPPLSNYSSCRTFNTSFVLFWTLPFVHTFYSSISFSFIIFLFIAVFFTLVVSCEIIPYI